jgi:hypothetical protein
MICISSRASDQDPIASIRRMYHLAKSNITFINFTYINMEARVPDVKDIVINAGTTDQVVPSL